MDENTFLVSLSMEETAKKIHSAVVDGSITGELLDHYVSRAQGEQYCIVAVYEKHYWRAGNRLTLTVTIDNLSGPTPGALHWRRRRRGAVPFRLGRGLLLLLPGL